MLKFFQVGYQEGELNSKVNRKVNIYVKCLNTPANKKVGKQQGGAYHTQCNGKAVRRGHVVRCLKINGNTKTPYHEQQVNAAYIQLALCLCGVIYFHFGPKVKPQAFTYQGERTTY